MNIQLAEQTPWNWDGPRAASPSPAIEAPVPDPPSPFGATPEQTGPQETGPEETGAVWAGIANLDALPMKAKKKAADDAVTPVKPEPKRTRKGRLVAAVLVVALAGAGGFGAKTYVTLQQRTKQLGTADKAAAAAQSTLSLEQRRNVAAMNTLNRVQARLTTTANHLQQLNDQLCQTQQALAAVQPGTPGPASCP